MKKNIDRGVWFGLPDYFRFLFGKQGGSTYEYLVFVFVFVFCPYPRFSPFSIFGELGGSSYEYLDRVEFQCMVGKQTVRLP